MAAELETLEVGSAAEWRGWLEAHHADSPGVWLTTWKSGRGPYVPYDALVDEAIAFGWVDSRPRALDEDRSQRLMSPRKASSNWSRVNKERVDRLTAEGRMAPAGLRAVEVAVATGTWTGLDDVEALVEPDDLRIALDATSGAREHWDAFPRSVKRAILEWIAGAKRPETRAKRVGETAAKAAVGIRANQWRQ